MIRVSILNRWNSGAAVFAGLAGAFIAGVNLMRAVRPALLVDPDPAWAVPRLLLGLAVVAGAAATGAVLSAAFLLWSNTRAAREGPVALPFSAQALALLAVAAILAGTFLRFARLDRVPWPVFIDESSLIAPALALDGKWCDFRDSIRPAPYRAKPFTMVGVLFLEGYRVALREWGTTIYAVRLPAALGSSVSLVTAALLGWALLPRGGGALTAVTLAGLRWHLNLSRWAWCPTTMMVTTDAGTLLLLLARRRRSAWAALLGGFLVGLGTHVYLSAWVAAAALGAFAAWPGESNDRRPRVGLAAAYLLGFAVSVLPLFLFREGRVLPYFNRAEDHNVLREVRYNRSLLPIASVTADALASPWYLPDPTRRHDLDRSRLGLLAIPLAVAFAGALLFPRRELSALLLLHAGAALAASVAGGQSGNPNGLRFGYLATITAVAIAAGTLSLLRLAPPAVSRTAALLAVGLLIVASAVGARESFVWSKARDTFDGFHGQDTLVGRAALRWDPYGRVRLDPAVPHDPVTVYVIRHYRLDTNPAVTSRARPDFWAPHATGRSLRIVPARTRPEDGERIAERIRDAWGRDWALVLARREPGVPGGHPILAAVRQ